MTSATARPPTPPRAASAPGDDDVLLLVEAARRGEPSAWDVLVRRFRPLVRRAAYDFSLDSAETDDIAQIVWLRLYEQLNRIREPRALSKWISTTARRECLRIARGYAATVSIDLVATPRWEGESIDGELLRSEAARFVREGLAELPTLQRDLLVLLATEPTLSYRTISRRLGMPVGSIGPTRARGLARLRRTPAMCSYFAERGPPRLLRRHAPTTPRREKTAVNASAARRCGRGSGPGSVAPCAREGST